MESISIVNDQDNLQGKGGP
jgi:hypothetical protein